MLGVLLQLEKNYVSFVDPTSGLFTRQDESLLPETVQFVWRILFSEHMTVDKRQATWQQWHMVPTSRWNKKALDKCAHFLLEQLDAAHDGMLKNMPYNSESNIFGECSSLKLVCLRQSDVLILIQNSLFLVVRKN
jgi:hypothetical protein